MKKTNNDYYTQNFIPIKDVTYGMIKTNDNKYIKILEVEPINFILRSPDEQEAIISTFASFLKICNVNIQFKSITKKADSEKYIELLKKDMVSEKVKKTKELSREYVKLIKEIGGQEALTRRFFVIFKYEPDSTAKKDDLMSIYKNLYIASQTVKSYLENCGNHIKEYKNENNFVGDFLYMFFNRRSSIEESFRSRIHRCVEDTMKQKGLIPGIDNIPTIPVTNFIAPRGLDLSHYNYIIMDGLYYTFMYIKSDGYPNSVLSGWMSSLVNAGEGVDIDIFFERQSRDKIIDKVNQKIVLNRVKLKDINDTSSDYEDVSSAYMSAQMLKQGLSNNQDVFYMNILITINDPTLEDLMWKKKQLKNMLKSKDFIVEDTIFQQEESLLSYMPLCNLSPEIKRKSKQNVLTASAASTYMFTSFEMCDDNGILLGVNQHNNTLCIIDLFNSKIYKNANMTILGTSGSGKTFTEQLMALRMRMRGIQCFIIAPLKGHEFRRACNSIGGTYIKISPGSKDYINIMEIRPTDDSTAKLLEGDDYETDSWLSKKIEQLNVFFSLLINDLSNEEEQILDECLITAYLLKDITHENSSLYDEDTGKLKPMPVLGDLFNIIKEYSRMTRVANILNKFVNGSAQSFNNQTNVDLDNKYIVFDISDLKGNMLPIGMFIALDYCWDKIKEDRTKKKAIFIDETWMLIGSKSNKFAAEFVLEIFKIIRGYGGAAIAATQDLTDFFALEDGKYGKGIINNSKTKIILQLETEEAETVRDTLKLSRIEIQQIKQFERGCALISVNNNKVPVRIRASNMETELITTDRHELEKQARIKKEQIANGN